MNPSLSLARLIAKLLQFVDCLSNVVIHRARVDRAQPQRRFSL